MSNNSITGELPSDIGQLHHLRNLTMSDNLLEGSIPSSITNCTRLVFIGLGINRITGKFPVGFGQLTNLTYLSVANNRMSGEIPDDLYNCSNLKILDVSDNNFTGSIEPSIGKLSNLERFQAGFNTLTGPIPLEIGNLSQLILLKLSGNRFSGSIPEEMSKLSNLQGLYLSENVLEDAIPEKIFELKQLTELDLHKNKLNGQIPAAISNLQQLSHLDLHGNMFNGSIPRSMASLTRLISLDLSQNSLTGQIPAPVLASMKGLQLYLDLSYNLLKGNIPDEIGGLEMVQAIDISNNNLSGVISKSLSRCRNLNTVDLSHNKFSGPLPAEAFVQMDFLTNLNFSSNDLDGKLPESLANLKHIMSLDLSNNRLEGKIPESLANLSSLKELNLSFNRLEGKVPNTGIFKNIDASSLVGNPSLCGTNYLKQCRNSLGISKKTLLLLLALGSTAIFLLVLLIFILNRPVKKHEPEEVIECPLEPELPSLRRFEVKELENATNCFDENNIIGITSLSTVYKGRLENGEIVAVKKLNLKQFPEDADKYFYREVKTMNQLRHRNLVKVIGYAWESTKLKALVLEYMENGSLESVIHGDHHSRWTFPERINVCISVAGAMEYLHVGYGFPIVHCDLKSSNILLDRDWVARVSDFVTARMLGTHLHDGSKLNSSSAFEGTIGYLAPEFAYMRKYTTKVDVFSFGITIMEFLTKRRPTGLTEDDGMAISLREMVEKALANGAEGIIRVLDPMLTMNACNEQEKALEELMKLTLFCTNENPEHRPTMKEVLSVLEKLKGRQYDNVNKSSPRRN